MKGISTMFENQPDLLTFNEARNLLRIGKNKMLELLWNDEIEGAFQIGHHWKIPKSGIVQYIRHH